MNIIESVKSAIASIQANKLRSFLTILGITIGVGTVIMLLALSLGPRTRSMRG